MLYIKESRRFEPRIKYLKTQVNKIKTSATWMESFQSSFYDLIKVFAETNPPNIIYSTMKE